MMCLTFCFIVSVYSDFPVDRTLPSRHPSTVLPSRHRHRPPPTRVRRRRRVITKR